MKILLTDFIPGSLLIEAVASQIFPLKAEKEKLKFNATIFILNSFLYRFYSAVEKFLT